MTPSQAELAAEKMSGKRVDDMVSVGLDTGKGELVVGTKTWTKTVVLFRSESAYKVSLTEREGQGAGQMVVRSTLGDGVNCEVERRPNK
jgi:hypothetical protein